MKTKTHILIAAALVLSVNVQAMKPAEAGADGIAFRISSQDQTDTKLTISPDAASNAGTLEMPVNHSRILVPGVMTNAIQYKSGADGKQNIRFVMKNGKKGTYHLTVSSAQGSSVSTVTLQ